MSNGIAIEYVCQSNKLIDFSTSCLPCTLQEMLDIMRSIYDMMGKYTYPTMQDDAPREHVETFFQVKLTHCYQLVPSFLILVKVYMLAF